jgi:hypothetical protein
MREQILSGKLNLPSYNKFVDSIGTELTHLADKMFNSLWNNYMKDKSSINLTYWYDKFGNPKQFNIVLMSLSKSDWIVTDVIPERNWAEAKLNENKLLSYVTVDELENTRANKKFTKYFSTCEESTKSNKTKINGRIKDTGLIREGFAKAGNSRYRLDIQYIDEYYSTIKANTTKSMDKIKEYYPDMKSGIATYDTISVNVLDYHRFNSDEIFTTGGNINDSRGRAISNCLSKVFNPIGYKDARSLLIIGD